MSDSRPDSRLFRWVDERYGISSLVEFFQHKEVPVGAHSIVWYYLGGTTLFFFSVQILTGVLLLMYYQPGESTSYESVRYLTTKVPFGWLIRSVHCWSAHLMILSLVVHMFSTMMLKAYRPPRELTWVTGFALFGLALGFGFSGYLLPWNELAFFATAVGTDSVKSVPVDRGLAAERASRRAGRDDQHALPFLRSPRLHSADRRGRTDRRSICSSFSVRAWRCRSERASREVG